MGNRSGCGFTGKLSRVSLCICVSWKKSIPYLNKGYKTRQYSLGDSCLRCSPADEDVEIVAGNQNLFYFALSGPESQCNNTR